MFVLSPAISATRVLGFATGAATCSSVRRSIRPGDHQQRRRCDLAPCPGRQCRIGICGSSKRSPATWRTGASAASYFITSDTFWALPPSALLAYVASKGAAGVMRTLAVTLGADGIAVSAAAPGLIDTPASAS